MKNLYLTIGLPGSGKTTYINREHVPYGAQIVSPDAIRKAYGHRYYGPLEPLIFTQAMFQVRALMHLGHDIVVDEATVQAGHVERWRKLADAMDYTLVALHMDTPVDVCLARRLEDGGEVFRDVILRKAASLERDRESIRSLADENVTVCCGGAHAYTDLV